LLISLKQNSENLTQEFKRLFHGRGGYFENYKYLTIDSIDTILSVAFYFEIDIKRENELIDILKEFLLLEVCHVSTELNFQIATGKEA